MQTQYVKMEWVEQYKLSSYVLANDTVSSCSCKKTFENFCDPVVIVVLESWETI